MQLVDATNVTTFEHKEVSVGEGRSGTTISAEEAERLELIPDFCTRGHRSVRLAQYCGIVNLGDRVLEILPKIDESSTPDECQGVLLRLLREAEEFPHFHNLPAGQHRRRAPLLDVFIVAFFEAVAQILRGGLLRQYREQEEDLRVVRGRIVARRQFAVLANRTDYIACRYDDLTADNTWNRLLKLGLRLVRPWMSGLELNRQWMELMVAFDEVQDIRFDIGVLDRLRFDRHAARYRDAVGWVRLIISLLSPSLRAGENAAPGLLVDMNQLFEAAIAAHLRRRMGSGYSVHAQEGGRHLATVDGRPAFGLRPDILIKRGSRVVAIADTKWKKLEADLMPTAADMYQMHAYASAFQCERLVLIYPWHSGLKRARETAFELPLVGGVRPVVSVVCIDVGDEAMPARVGADALQFGDNDPGRLPLA